MSVEDYARGVEAGDRSILARALTLVESSRPDHQDLAQELLERLLPRTGRALRLGVTGVPGAGKSTFIEALGGRLLDKGKRVAVLAVDPSSAVSGGSILGDKTRMQTLAADPRAFVRPSPSSGSLGGVARKTREAMLVLEAAGYDVETMGVGQAEVMVAQMVDCVLLLLVPGAGDELQGIKRGILELVDLVAVNKADGDQLLAAKRARNQYARALHFIRPRHAGWTVPVLAVSAVEGSGLGELWESVAAHRRTLEQSGEFERMRREQRRQWMWSLIEDALLDRFRRDPRVAELLPEIEAGVEEGALHPSRAARRLLGRADGAD